MTDTWTTCQIIANWLESNQIDASPLAVIFLTNVILQSISTAREESYRQGQKDARKDNSKCKQP